MLDGLWLASQGNCDGADANAVLRMKRKLADMTELVGMALAQDSIPGAAQRQSSGQVLEIATARIVQGPLQVRDA